MGLLRGELIVVADADAMARAAAERISAHLQRRDRRVAICLTGGSSPEGLYALLATAPYREAWPWKHIHVFWGDDRYVPQDDRLSNFGAARHLLLEHVPIPSGNIHAIPTSAASPAEAARQYEAELHRFYGAERLDPARPMFDVVLMGVGTDGHTASLFPGQATLEEKERWVVGVSEAGLAPFVPRVTLTYPALAATHEMLFLVDGDGKRQVMRQVLAGADLPATHAYAWGNLVWLVTRDAVPERQDVA
jgi:6-phosphogluconolactonase